MTDDELILRIRDDKTIRVEIREGADVRTKIITIDTLIDCIRSSLSGVSVSTGLLPENVRSFSFNCDANQRYIVMEFTDERANITYMNTEYSDFPLPRLLFGFCIEESGRISKVNLGIPALGPLTPETPMYFYPFSNVNTFTMCTGANSLPHIKSLQQLTNLPYYILSLPDNDDYFKDRYNRPGMGHRELLEHLQDKNRQYYYDEVLIPMPNKILKNFI